MTRHAANTLGEALVGLPDRLLAASDLKTAFSRLLALPPGPDPHLTHIRDLAASMTGKNWRQVRDDIVRLLS